MKALLESIDRSTGDGLRDYTMLLLIAAYGLRVSEVAALTSLCANIPETLRPLKLV